MNVCFTIHAKRTPRRLLVTWRHFFGAQNKCFVWRRRLDQLTAASSKFSVSMEAGCSPFAWARSMLCFCIEIQFEIVNGMVSNTPKDQQGKICVCIGRCFEIIYQAYTVCFYNLLITRRWLIHLSNIFTLAMISKPRRKAEEPL